MLPRLPNQAPKHKCLPRFLKIWSCKLCRTRNCAASSSTDKTAPRRSSPVSVPTEQTAPRPVTVMPTCAAPLAAKASQQAFPLHFWPAPADPQRAEVTASCDPAAPESMASSARSALAVLRLRFASHVQLMGQASTLFLQTLKRCSFSSGLWHPMRPLVFLRVCLPGNPGQRIVSRSAFPWAPLDGLSPNGSCLSQVVSLDCPGFGRTVFCLRGVFSAHCPCALPKVIAVQHFFRRLAREGWSAPSSVVFQSAAGALTGFAACTKITSSRALWGCLTLGLSGTSTSCWGTRFVSCLQQLGRELDFLLPAPFMWAAPLPALQPASLSCYVCS